MLGIVVEGNVAWSLLCLSSAATTVAAARAVRQRARRMRIAKRLAELDIELPLATGHLTPALEDLTRQARILRLVLTTPLQRIPDNTWRDTPWRRRQRCDEYDRALVEARRAVWDWLNAARRLPGTDRAVLRNLRIDLSAVRGALFAPRVLERTADPWEEALFPVPPDVDVVADALCDAMQDLSRFEIAVSTMRADPYR